MEESKDGIAVKEEKLVPLDLNMEESKDGIEVKEEKLAPLDLTVNPDLVELDLPGTICFPKYDRNAAACKELRSKLRCMIKESAADFEEGAPMHHQFQTYLKIQSEKMAINDLIKMNRQCSQLKKVWMNRGLPVDKETIQSAAASKDTFDMSSLSASLPSTSDKSEDKFMNRTKQLTKEFLAIVQMKRLLLKRSERDSVPASIDAEFNNNRASCSHKARQPKTLSQMVKHIYSDRKNMSYLSWRPVRGSQKVPDGPSNSIMSYLPVRPMLRKGPGGSGNSSMSYPPLRPMIRNGPDGSTNSSMSSLRSSMTSSMRSSMSSLRPSTRIQKVPDSSSNSSMSYFSLPSTRIHMDPDCSSKSGVNTERTDDPEDHLYVRWIEQERDEESGFQNNLIQREECRLQWRKEALQEYNSLLRSCARRRHVLARHIQQLRDSKMLERQMSRLNITNSMRADLKEAEAESETVGSSSADQMNEDQDKAARENRRKAISVKLKELLLLLKGTKVSKGTDLTKET